MQGHELGLELDKPCAKTSLSAAKHAPAESSAARRSSRSQRRTLKHAQTLASPPQSVRWIGSTRFATESVTSCWARQPFALHAPGAPPDARKARASKSDRQQRDNAVGSAGLPQWEEYGSYPEPCPPTAKHIRRWSEAKRRLLSLESWW